MNELLELLFRCCIDFDMVALVLSFIDYGMDIKSMRLGSKYGKSAYNIQVVKKYKSLSLFFFI